MQEHHSSWWKAGRVRRRWPLAMAALAVASTLAACGSSKSTSTENSGSAGSSGGSVSASSSGSSSSSSESPFKSAAESVEKAGVTSWTGFCGTKPITLGVEDGFGTNAYSQETMAAVRSTAAQCPNVKVIADIAQGNLQTAISQINSLAAQGANAMTVIADFGAAELPAMRAAMEKGVKVWNFAIYSEGKPGVDFEKQYIDFPPHQYYVEPARWLGKVLHCKGNVILDGGPAGNVSARNFSKDMLKGIEEACPEGGINILNKWLITEWTPASAQKAMAAELAKHPQIDGIVTDYGGDSIGFIKAFQAAGRKLVPIGTSSANELACDWEKLHKTNPDFQIGTNTTRTWMGRVAAREAIASAEGVPDNEPLNFEAPLYENSVASLRSELGGIAPQCKPSEPGWVDFSNQISPALVEKYGKPTG